MNLQTFHSISLALIIALLSACEGTEQQVQEVQDQMERQIDTLSNKVEEYASKTAKYTTETAMKVPELAEEEYEKLFRFDYQVVQLPRDNDYAKLESTLNELGKDRWECFHLEPKDEKWIAFCRRRPTSYIRYIKSLIGFF